MLAKLIKSISLEFRISLAEKILNFLKIKLYFQHPRLNMHEIQNSEFVDVSYAKVPWQENKIWHRIHKTESDRLIEFLSYAEHHAQIKFVELK